MLSMEMGLRIFCLGLINGPNTYLSASKYNLLDFIIVLSSWAFKVLYWVGIFQPLFPGTLLQPCLW